MTQRGLRLIEGGHHEATTCFIVALIFTISIVLLGISCKKGPVPPAAPSGFEKSLTITLTNPLETTLPNQAVVIPVGEIASTVADFNPLNCEFNAGGSAVPYQADDLDGDGKPDELAFVLSSALRARRPSTCRYSPTGSRPNPFPAATYARLAWEAVNANIGWESNSAAYRFYWGQLEAFGKLDKTLIMSLFTADYGYHNMQSWGMDILHVGDASGLGGISLWEGENRISTVNPAGKGIEPIRAQGDRRRTRPGRRPGRYQRHRAGQGAVHGHSPHVRLPRITPSRARTSSSPQAPAATSFTAPASRSSPRRRPPWTRTKAIVATWGEGAPGAGEVGLAVHLQAPASTPGSPRTTSTATSS